MPWIRAKTCFTNYFSTRVYYIELFNKSKYQSQKDYWKKSRKGIFLWSFWCIINKNEMEPDLMLARNASELISAICAPICATIMSVMKLPRAVSSERTWLRLIRDELIFKVRALPTMSIIQPRTQNNLFWFHTALILGWSFTQTLRINAHKLVSNPESHNKKAGKARLKSAPSGWWYASLLKCISKNKQKKRGYWFNSPLSWSSIC